MKNCGLSRAKSNGFTLLETLLYIALFSILMSGAVVAANNLLESGGRNDTNSRVQEEGTFISRKLNWALTGASAVGVSGGGTTLTITRPDLGSESPLVFTGDGTTVTIRRTGSGSVPLNNDRFVIKGPMSGHMFSAETTGGRPTSVTASFQINGQPFIFKTYVRLQTAP